MKYKYLAIQLITFVSITLIYHYLRPHIPFNVPPGKYWPGYGAMVIPALIYSYKNWRLFIGVSGCGLIWGVSRYVDLSDQDFLAHAAILYGVLAMFCAPLRLRWMGIIAAATALYCFGLIVFHWSVRPSLSYFEILVANMLHSALLIIPVMRSVWHEAQEKDRIADSFDFWKKAA